MKHQFFIRYYDDERGQLVLEHARDGAVATEHAVNVRHPCWGADLVDATQFLFGVAAHLAGFALTWDQLDRGTMIAVSEEYEL